MHLQILATMSVPHLVPSGTRPGIVSAPGRELKDLKRVKNTMDDNNLFRYTLDQRNRCMI